MPNHTVSGNVDTMMRAVDNAAIRSAIGVGTTDAPTFLAQTLTGQSLTGTQATSLVDLSATWNTTGTPSALKLNVTDTASNAASNLMDLQKGGISTFKVAKNGNITLNNAARATISDNGSGLTIGDAPNSNAISIYANVGFGRSLRLDFEMALAWNTIGFGSGADLGLWRDAPGILAQRNGTSAQAFRVYDTYDTAGTNYERGTFGFPIGTNTLRIGTEQAGTGAAQPIDFVTGGSIRMSIAAAGLVTIDSISITRGTGTNSTNLSVGSVLSSNTTGIGNSGIGYSSLNSNTTGSFNVALGNNALQNNSTGGSNAAIGIYALNANSTGGNNMAIGGAALQANTTGSYNVAIGSLAGYYIADGATGNATGSNSLFLGSNTKALGAAQTNQTVIGDNATGSGSNSTTLNNTATTLTKIKGTAAHVLDVTGTIKLSPPASVTPANNGELMVEATSNTTLTFKFKGSDGTVRSGTVILA